MSAIENAIERRRVALRRLARLHELLQCYESLSRREREVMSGVVAGRLNKQIGGDLGISEITVKAHRGNLMRRMRARSLADSDAGLQTLRVACQWIRATRQLITRAWALDRRCIILR